MHQSYSHTRSVLREGIPITQAYPFGSQSPIQRTGEERLFMGCAMRDTARAFVEASLREQDPQATVATIRTGLFLRFYGHEFDEPTRDKILAAIERTAQTDSRHH